MARSTRTSRSRAWPATCSCSATARWRIRRVERGRCGSTDAQGQPPHDAVLARRGAGPHRRAVRSRSRACAGDRRARCAPIAARRAGLAHGPNSALGCPPREQIVAVPAAGSGARHASPPQRRSSLERFFDEAGGMQLVVHAPFGSRINRAWGLALRKRFCRTFDFELQARRPRTPSYLSLGRPAQFPLDDVFAISDPKTADGCWSRRCSTRRCSRRAGGGTRRALSLALRAAAGGRSPPQLQRMQAEDLLGGGVSRPDRLP